MLVLMPCNHTVQQVSLAHFGAASGAAVNQDSGPVGMSGGDGGTIRPAQETHACVKTMLATEEGLNHQVSVGDSTFGGEDRDI